MALREDRRHSGAMSNAAEDPRDALSSLDSLKAYLAGVVTVAANSRGPKVELTYVGGEFRRLAGMTFERHLTVLAEEKVLSVPKPKRKLADFIEAYCSELISRERSEAGTWLVYPAQHGGTDAHAPSTKVGGPAALRFKPAVWAAFIRPLKSGHRYLNLEQIGFTDNDGAPTGGLWKEIDPAHILGAEQNEPVDGTAVQSQIEAWANAAGVPLSTLLVSTAKEPARPLKQLLELIDMLPPEVSATWSIPALVLKHLARAR